VASGKLDRIRALLKAEVGVRRGTRIWAGRLVLERHVTHILVVSDAPGRTYGINRLLEEELLRLAASFSVTEPLVVSGPELSGLYLA
jgi:hypothetical protein